MIINAALSHNVMITDCNGYSCANLTVYCPINNKENSCSIRVRPNGSETFLHNLQIYTISDGDYNNINITKEVSISRSTLKCNRGNNNNNECLMDERNMNLCVNGLPLDCDDIIFNTTMTDIFTTFDI